MYSMCCNSTDNDAGDRDIWLSDCLPIFATILLSSKKKNKKKRKKVQSAAPHPSLTLATVVRKWLE